MFRIGEKHGHGQVGILEWLGLIPKYTETSLFLTALTFTLLYLADDGIRDTLESFAFHGFDVRAIIFLLIFFAGLLYSFYYALSDKKTPEFARTCMLIFVVFTNFGVGAYSGLYVLQSAEGYLAIFPLMNLVNAFLLIIMFRAKIIDETCLSNENASRPEILVGSAALLVIFAFSHYIMHNYWALTFSICLAYSTMINEFFTRIFFQTSATK